MVAGRALGFLDNLGRGEVRVGVVYDPAVAQSAQQARGLEAGMDGGLRIGNHTLRPVMVPIGQVSGARVDVFFMTVGLGAEGSAIGRVSRARKISCITFDLDQVRNGNCAMGVRAQPKIEVLVNRAAAAASGMELATVFRVMITEI